MKFTLGTILFIIGSNILMAQRVVEIDELGNKVIGKMAPGFTGTTLDNLEFDLAELRGKVVLLDFWSLSCAACFKELPDLNEIVKKYRNDKFILVSLMDNTREELVRKFEAKDGGYKMKKPVFGNDEIAFQIIPDAKDIMEIYSEQLAFPRAFIINQNGVVVNHFLGYAEKRGVPDEQTTIVAMSQAISRRSLDDNNIYNGKISSRLTRLIFNKVETYVIGLFLQEQILTILILAGRVANESI